MARPGRPSGMRPDISSGDRCPSRMGLTASGRLPGPSMGLGRLKRSLLLSAFLCAADARQRRPAGPCQPFRPISRDMAGLSLWSSLAIWLAPSWPFQRTMMSSRSAMPRWLQSSMAPPTMHASAGIIIGRAWALPRNILLHSECGFAGNCCHSDGSGQYVVCSGVSFPGCQGVWQALITCV